MSHIEDFKYQRHSEFINQLEQEKLGKASILIAGCGIGSQLATRLVRMGIATQGGLILADPGVVEVSNLSRQDYYEEDLGKNKVDVMSINLRRIDKEARIQSVTEGVTLENVADLVQRVDFVADMIDISAPHISFALHAEAERQHKPVTTGLDVGEGTIIYVFDYRDPNAMTLRNFLGLPQTLEPEELASFPSLALTVQFILGAVGITFPTIESTREYYNGLIESNLENIYANLPSEMHPVADKLRTGVLNYIPQIDSAVALQAVQQSVIIRRLILNQLVILAPRSIRRNLIQEVAPS